LTAALRTSLQFTVYSSPFTIEVSQLTIENSLKASDTFVKRIEIAFRRVVIQFLKLFFQKKKNTPLTGCFETAKYLFIRQDMIGDVLISTPLFGILKNKYPKAQIDVLLSPKNYFVLQNDPLIRKRWIYDKHPLHTIGLIRDIRRENYDFTVDLMDNPSATSTILCLLSGAKETIGLEKKNSYAYSTVIPLLSRKNSHIIERIAQLLTSFDIHVRNEDISVRYTPLESSREKAARFLKENFQAGKKIVGINISAGGEVRFWGVAHYKNLLEYLLKTYPQLQIAVLYKPEHREKAVEIAGSSDAKISPLTNSFDEFAALIEKMSLLITPDTSAVHLTSAFHIPAVVLYVQSNKELRIWEPFNTEYEAIVTNRDDLSTIPEKPVEEAVDRIIKRTGIC
jgi:ADP-heptose:LPS heptosyltransferase